METRPIPHSVHQNGRRKSPALGYKGESMTSTGELKTGEEAGNRNTLPRAVQCSAIEKEKGGRHGS